MFSATAALQPVETNFQINVEQVRMRALKYHEEKEVSQTKVSRAIGIGNSTYHAWINGTYNGDNEGIATKVKSYLDNVEASLEAIKAPGYIETTVGKEILAMITYARMQNEMGLIAGDAGLGKTIALEEYCRMNPDTIMIRANPTISSPKAIVEEILEAMGKDSGGTLRKQIKHLIRLLAGSNRVIIFDECQHLEYRALETLRTIYDETKVTLILAGNQVIYDRMHGRREAQFAQLFSRVGITRVLSNEVKKVDVATLAYEVKADIDDDCLEYLWRVANTPGGLRQMMKLLILAVNLGKGKVLSIKILKQARGFLMQ